MDNPSSPNPPRPAPSGTGFAPSQPGGLDGTGPAAGEPGIPGTSDASEAQRLAQWHALVERLQELNTQLEYLRLMLRLGVGKF